MENIDIWPSYWPKMEPCRILAINLAIFGTIGLKILVGTQETIIYRLVMEISGIILLFAELDLFILDHFWWGKRRGQHARPYRSWLQNPSKKSAPRRNFWVM